jgi:hypothetical protein
VWFGTCSLAIQFWNIYSIVNGQGKSVRAPRDGVNLKFTFKKKSKLKVCHTSKFQILECD